MPRDGLWQELQSSVSPQGPHAVQAQGCRLGIPRAAAAPATMLQRLAALRRNECHPSAAPRRRGQFGLDAQSDSKFGLNASKVIVWVAEPKNSFKRTINRFEWSEQWFGSPSRGSQNLKRINAGPDCTNPPPAWSVLHCRTRTYPRAVSMKNPTRANLFFGFCFGAKMQEGGIAPCCNVCIAQ